MQPIRFSHLSGYAGEMEDAPITNNFLHTLCREPGRLEAAILSGRCVPPVFPQFVICAV